MIVFKKALKKCRQICLCLHNGIGEQILHLFTTVQPKYKAGDDVQKESMNHILRFLQPSTELHIHTTNN